MHMKEGYCWMAGQAGRIPKLTKVKNIRELDPTERNATIKLGIDAHA